MAKNKSKKTIRNKSVGWLHTLLLMGLLAILLCTFYTMSIMLGPDMNTITEFLDGQDELMRTLLFLINIIVISFLLIWYMLKYTILLLPSLIALALLTPALILLRSSGVGGKYSYKYARNRSSGRSSAVLCFIFCGLSIIGLLISQYLAVNTTDGAGNPIAQIPQVYSITCYVLSGISLLTGLITLRMANNGVNKAQANGEISEEQEINQRLTQQEPQTGGYTVGGVSQSLQVTPNNSHNNTEK